MLVWLSLLAKYSRSQSVGLRADGVRSVTRLEAAQKFAGIEGKTSRTIEV